MELNILTLPGYGDKIDNTDAWRPVKLVLKILWKLLKKY